MPPKPFNWENPSANSLSDIKREAQLLGVKIPSNAKKMDALQRLIMAKTQQDIPGAQTNEFQQSNQSQSATNSPKIKSAKVPQGSKTPLVKASKKAQTRKPPAAKETFISPLLLGQDNSPQQSPTIKNSPVLPSKQKSPSPVPQIQEHHSPSPRPQIQEHHSPSPRPQIQEHSSSHRPQIQEHQSSSTRSPTPKTSSRSRHHRKPVPNSNYSRSPTPIRYGKDYYSSDYESESVSGKSSFLNQNFIYILIFLLVLSCVHPIFGGLFFIALIYYIYLKYQNKKKSDNKNISDF